MKNWYTADTHFGSERTLELSRRPFKSVKEMDYTMINNWNKLVGENDMVNHVGDFGDYNNIKNLKGHVRLIIGNYERADIKKRFNNSFEEFEIYLKELGFFEVVKWEKYVSPILNDFGMACLCHEPTNMHESVFNLFAHVHKLSMVKKNGLNIGTDCHNFYPIDNNVVEFYKNAIENFYDDNVFL